MNNILSTLISKFAFDFNLFMVSCIIFTQFKTVYETDITAIETMRETELRTELATWKTKYEEIVKKTDETVAKINEYKTLV